MSNTTQVDVLGMTWTVRHLHGQMWIQYISGQHTVTCAIDECLKINGQEFTPWGGDSLEEIEDAPEIIKEAFKAMLDGVRMDLVWVDDQICKGLSWEDRKACESMSEEDLKIVGVTRVTTKRETTYHDCGGCTDIREGYQWAYTPGTGGFHKEVTWTWGTGRGMCPGCWAAELREEAAEAAEEDWDNEDWCDYSEEERAMDADCNY